MALGLLLGAWLAGTLGGLHCMTMCGGFAAALAGRDGGATAARPLLPLAAILRRQAAYQAGRIATYTVLGAAFGAVGAVLLDAAALTSLQRAVYVVANVLLLALALRLVVALPSAGWLQRAGSRAFGTVLPLVQPLLRQPGVLGRLLLGSLWGLVPCTLVYSVLPLATFSGGAWSGAAVMLAFGVGTLPNVSAAGILLGRTPTLRHGRGLRLAAAAVLVAFAAAGIYRVLYDPGSLASGPFCIVP